LVERDLDLDEFVHLFAKEEGFELAHYVHRTHGHWTSTYPIVTPVLIAPLYLPVSLWLWSHDVPYASPLWVVMADWMEKLSASLVAALSAVFVYLTLKQLCQPRAALALTLAYALATNTWAISSQALWQHGMSELMLAVACYALLKAGTDVRFLVLAGLGTALAVANRVPNILFALAFVMYVMQVHRRQTWRFLGFPVVIGGLFLVYNLFYFDNLTGAAGADPRGALGMEKWSTPLGEGIVGLLVSPSRGLFIYIPFTLFSLWGIYKVWREEEWPLLLRYLSLGVPMQVTLYAKWAMWWGGSCYGPRLLTDMLPILVFLLVPILPYLRGAKRLRAVFSAAVLYSLGVQVTGAFYYVSTPASYWEGSPIPLDTHPERLWDWSDTQILRSVRHGGLVFPFYEQAKEYLFTRPARVFEAEELPRRVGTVVGAVEASGGRAVTAQEGESGWVVFGPYQVLPAGKYRVKVFLKLQGEGVSEEVAILDVATDAGTKVLTRRALTGKDFSILDQFQAISLPFQVTVADAYKRFEYRVLATGRQPLVIDRIILEKEDAP
jgi:hypothetical protein